MLICTRTTINLPDALVEAAKMRARQEGRTFTSVVEEGLRAVLEQRSVPAQRAPMPAYGSATGRFLVDLTDREAVAGALDAGGLR